MLLGENMKDFDDKLKGLDNANTLIDDGDFPWAENNDKETKEFDLEKLSKLLKIDIIEKMIN